MKCEECNFCKKHRYLFVKGDRFFVEALKDPKKVIEFMPTFLARDPGSLAGFLVNIAEAYGIEFEFKGYKDKNDVHD